VNASGPLLRRSAPGNSEPAWLRICLTALALLFIALFIVMPLAAIFVQAFEKGWQEYVAAISEQETLSSLGLTLLITVLVVPLNLLFGVAAAWAITKFRFRGKQLMVTLIDLPFCVSPVIAGMIFVLVFGLHGLLGPWLASRNIAVIFALPGIMLATLFITVPFVARELIPLMQEQGTEEEEAAMVLGAGGWKTFWRVTLPNIK